MRTRIIALAGAGALVLAGVATGPAYAADGVKLSVLHAVPGLTVDVYVDGKLTLDDFKPGTLAGPLDLKAGTYEVATEIDGSKATASFTAGQERSRCTVLPSSRVTRY